MAVVTRRPSEIEHRYSLKCKGLTKDEFWELYEALAEGLQDERPAVRNPYLPHFDGRTIHEISLYLISAGALVGRETIKQGLSVIRDIIKSRFSERANKITLYDGRQEG